MSPTPAENGTNTPKELELMGKLKSLEEDRVKFVEIVRNKVKKLEGELDVSVRLPFIDFSCFLQIKSKFELFRIKMRKMHV